MNLEFEAPTIAATASSVLPDIGSLQPFSANLAPSLGEGFNFNPSFGMEIKPITINAAAPSLELHFPSLENIQPQIHLDKTVPVPEVVFNEKLFEAIRPNVAQDAPFQIQPLPAEISVPISILEKEADLKAREEAINMANILFPGSITEQNFWVEKIRQIEKMADSFDASASIDLTAPEIVLPLAAEPSAEPQAEKAVEIVSNPKTETQASNDVQTEIETQTQPETVAQTATGSGMQGPNVPIALESESEQPNDEAEPETLPRGKEPEWDEYVTSEANRVAKASLKKRRNIAKEILKESISDEGLDLTTKVEAKIYKLDVPDIAEAVQIASRKLEYPQITTRVEANLLYIENRDDPIEVHTAIDKAISKTPPIEKTRKVVSATRKKQSDLSGAPKRLANQGAKFIALLKDMVWVRTKRLKLEEPVEMKKVEKKDDKKQNLRVGSRGLEPLTSTMSM